MSGGGRIGTGRVLAVGLGLWFRRFPLVHGIAVLCLAPMFLIPEGGGVEQGTVLGVYGLTTTAWIMASDLTMGFARGFSTNVGIGYVAQFAVTAILVRDAHGRLAGRRSVTRLRSLFALAVHAGLSLAVFVLLDVGVIALVHADAEEVAIFASVGSVVVQALLGAWFSLALPAAAIDGHGLLGALGRSARLGRGARLPLVLVLVVLVVLQTCFLIVSGLVGRGVSWPFAVLGVVIVALKACVLAAAYREASVVREGLPPEEVGAVFA